MTPDELMGIGTYRIGTRRKTGQGVRLGVVRFLPRGVSKRDYARLGMFDVWMPVLAPSRGLLRWMRDRGWNDRTLKTFFARYAREMESQTDSRQMIRFLAKLGKRTDVSIGCYCADESMCHRSVLLRLIRSAK